MNNYDKALSLCLPDPKLEHRKWTHLPFIIGDNVYSTNCYLMGYAPVSKLEQEYDSINGLSPESVLSSIPEPKEAILTVCSQDFEFFRNHCPKVEDFDTIGENKDCRCCDGKGEVEYELFYEKQTYYEWLKCPICIGVGVSEQEVKKPNGKMIFDYNKEVRIGLSHFNTRSFEILMNICELLGSDAELISQEGILKQSLFRIGDFHLLLMPRYHESDWEDTSFFSIQPKKQAI